ncbi:MAG: hypothetical protein R3B70_22650 [Polyangiaceae bacterium]
MRLERVLELARAGGPPAQVTVSIGPPVQVGEDWTAALEIVGLSEPHRSEHHGVDSLSAVLAAARIAPVVLESIAGPGALTWLGDPDLGFPFLPFS